MRVNSYWNFTIFHNDLLSWSFSTQAYSTNGTKETSHFGPLRYVVLYQQEKSKFLICILLLDASIQVAFVLKYLQIVS